MNRQIQVVLLAAAFLSHTAFAGGPSDSLSPEQVLERAIDGQADLRDFSARAKTDIWIGQTKLSLAMKMYAKRPNNVAVEVLGIKVRPENGLMLPAPETFLQPGEYRLSSGGTKETAQGRFQVVNAAAARRGQKQLSWRLEIEEDTWVLTAAEAWDGDGNHSRIQAVYRRVSEFCWVPTEFNGQGALLLKTALPSGLITGVFDAASEGKPVRFHVALTEHVVNAGIEGSVFR